MAARVEIAGVQYGDGGHKWHGIVMPREPRDREVILKLSFGIYNVTGGDDTIKKALKVLLRERRITRRVDYGAVIVVYCELDIEQMRELNRQAKTSTANRLEQDFTVSLRDRFRELLDEIGNE